MRRRVISVILATILAAALPACASGARTDAISVNPVAFRAAETLSPSVSDALAGFSLDLFRRLAAEDAGKNVFVSPLSVWLALCMTYNGAAGETAVGMAEALHASGISIDELNQDNAGLMGLLTAADPGVKIAMVNSIWMRKDLAGAFNKDFIDRDRKHYSARIEKLDFTEAGAADTINRWVSDNTNGNIKNLVQPPIDNSTVMLLINAVHFKAPWKKAFDEKRTVDGKFTMSDGKAKTVKYLSSKDDNIGYADSDLVAARIPYASGRLEMVVLMPLQMSLADFVQGLSAESLNTDINRCEQTSMSLQLPKFKLDYSATLNNALKAMGMQDAFGNADFSNMSESMGKQLFISEVKHKSFIEIDEKGTEASAATVVMVAGAMPTSLQFNKPFVYMIRDTKTGAILFIGTMENPA